MKVSVQWYSPTGAPAGTETTIASEIQERCANAHCSYLVSVHGVQLATPTLVAVYRLATGEVARVYRV